MRRLFIWDFDKSVTEKDTDDHAIELLSSDELRRVVESDKKTMQWTDMVAKFLKAAHREGVTRDRIVSIFKSLPIHPDVRAVFQLAKGQDAKTIVLSDANELYIQATLEAHGLESFVSEIISNPVTFSEDGFQTFPTITCLLQGKELRELEPDYLKCYDQRVYVGDGRNDYCPILLLQKGDIAFIRKGHGLIRMLEKRPEKRDAIQATIVYWDNASDILSFLKSN
ncbi:MAG: hypothetical protein SGCHY_003162 [Lobulomycetales sp.]